MPDSLPTSRGLCRIPAGASLVVDADEEVFFLYTDLAAKSNSFQSTSTGFRGLGYLDSHKDTLTIPFNLQLQSGRGKEPDHKSNRKSHKRGKHSEDRSFEIQLVQDKTALRSRKGDTGSVVWRASIELAQMLLLQHYTRQQDALLIPIMLPNAHVLELGAGTGLLSIALARLVRQYTATDLEELIPLIRKNVRTNIPGWEETSLQSSHSDHGRASYNVKVEALDWLSLQQCPPNARRKAYSYETVDLLLIVDCIYHPSLLPALVATIDHLSTPEHTAVLVVVELRAEDVIREFLELWLNASGRGTWEIWHVHVNAMMEGPYAAWIGWKKLS